MRCSFFEVLSRYLSDSYTFAIEQNLPSGRADLVLTGIPGSSFHNDCRIVEFKYFKASESAKVEAIEAPREEDFDIMLRPSYYMVLTSQDKESQKQPMPLTMGHLARERHCPSPFGIVTNL